MKKSIRLFLLMPTVVLLIAAACYLSFKAVEKSIIEENEAAVHNMAQSLLPALMVGDAQQIDSLLKTLASNPGIQSAELISGTGIPLAAYVHERMAVDPAQSQFALASAEGGMNAYELSVVAPLTFDTQVLANLHVAVNLWPAYLRVIQILGILLIIPSLFYVLVKQLRLKIRVEKAFFGGDSGSDGQFDIDNALQEALKDAEISLEYQPIKRLSDNGFFGAEVVVCWKHPSGQTLHVSPADFIALAESSGLFLPFGTWVLETATQQVAAWQSQHGPLVLALNIAPSQLKDPDFYQKVRSACVAVQYPHQLLEFEINETALMRHTSALEDVRAFTKQGMSLTVDGFGLSSRSQDLLHSLAIQKVKFDPKLIKNIANDPEMLAFVGSVAELAASLDIQVMADGLRSQEQTDHMIKLGCILGQGPHQSQPLSPMQFEAMLVNQSRGGPVVVATTQTGVVGSALSY